MSFFSSLINPTYENNFLVKWSIDTFGTSGPIGNIAHGVGETVGDSISTVVKETLSGLTSGLTNSKSPTGTQTDFMKIALLGVAGYFILKNIGGRYGKI